MIYCSTLSLMTKPFRFQGYLAFFDNFYTSPDIVVDLKEHGMGSTGTIKKNKERTIWQGSDTCSSTELLQRNRLPYTNLSTWNVWLLVRQKVSQSCPTVILGMKIAQQQDTWRISGQQGILKFLYHSQLLQRVHGRSWYIWLTHWLLLYCPSKKRYWNTFFPTSRDQVVTDEER